MTATAIQVGGTHYRDMKIQPVDFILSNAMGFCEGNVVKYVCRHRVKNGIEDLRKARHYLQLLMDCPWYMALFLKIRSAYIYATWGHGAAITAREFIAANGLEGDEACIIECVWIWNCNGFPGGLEAAMKYLDDLIQAETPADANRG